MSNLEAWKTWQKKIAVSSNYKNPNLIAEIGCNHKGESNEN